MSEVEEREFWISKGRSNFCSDLVYDYESDSYVKCSPDGFYDVVSEKDTIEGGVHVIEYSAYKKAVEALKWIRRDIKFDRLEDVIVTKIDETLRELGLSNSNHLQI